MVLVPGPGWSNLGLATLTPSRDAYLLKVLTKVYFTYIKLAQLLVRRWFYSNSVALAAARCASWV